MLLLVPLTVLCLRTGKWRPFFVTLGATVATWVAVNLPVYLATPQGWLNFWTFNVDRGGDLGSIWYVLSMAQVQVDRSRGWWRRSWWSARSRSARCCCSRRGGRGSRRAPS